jgi:hypothetical protein
MVCLIAKMILTAVSVRCLHTKARPRIICPVYVAKLMTLSASQTALSKNTTAQLIALIAERGDKSFGYGGKVTIDAFE